MPKFFPAPGSPGLETLGRRKQFSVLGDRRPLLEGVCPESTCRTFSRWIEKLENCIETCISKLLSKSYNSLSYEGMLTLRKVQVVTLYHTPSVGGWTPKSFISSEPPLRAIQEDIGLVCESWRSTLKFLNALFRIESFGTNLGKVSVLEGSERFPCQDLTPHPTPIIVIHQPLFIISLPGSEGTLAPYQTQFRLPV